MKRQLYFLLLFAGLTVTVFAQKTACIPNYLQDVGNVDGNQFSWSKTRQSANFTLIWGNTVGPNPANPAYLPPIRRVAVFQVPFKWNNSANCKQACAPPIHCFNGAGGSASVSTLQVVAASMYCIRVQDESGKNRVLPWLA